ncbi:MAG: hypothetical protein H6968_19735 [Chromatiaceae bacterium]|nr:hypothetical protein [Chromatiaceae bacterium]
MARSLPILMIAMVLAACEQAEQTPPKVDVNVTIEEKNEQRKPLMPEAERSTIQGNGQRFTRP